MQSHFVSARRTKLRNQAKVACSTSVVPYGTQRVPKVAQVANERESPRKKWSKGFMRRPGRIPAFFTSARCSFPSSPAGA